MALFAILGVAANGYAAWKLSSGKTMNERVASWRLLEDVLGWAAVLVVAVVLLFKDILTPLRRSSMKRAASCRNRPVFFSFAESA